MELMQSKVGKKYNYFGCKAVKPKLRPDLKWDANDKIDQYNCIQKIFQLNFDLERAKHESEFKEKKSMLNELEQKVKEKQLKLNDLKTGEFQKIRNLLKERKEPTNPQTGPDKIMEDFECKLFDKKKMLDRMRYEQEKLCRLYEHRLIHLAEMQDQEKYTESCENVEKMKVKHLEYSLENAEIQIQTYENFLNDCESVINQLTEESLYYANALNFLESELNEQNLILNSINKLGYPAHKSALKSKKYAENMKKQTHNESSKRQTTISTYKRNLLKGEQNIFKHLPKDENFQAIAPIRYIRETPSVLELRLHYQTIENDTNQFCDAAACSNTTDLYATVREIFSKLKAGGEKINVLENQLSEMEERIGKTKRNRNLLSYSVKQSDIEVTHQTEQIDQHIRLDMQTRTVIANKADKIKSDVFKVRFAMQHLVNLLRNVNGDRPMIRKEYPNHVLSLPLFDLHLGSYDDATIPPEIVEEDVDILFNATFDRITALMAEYTKGSLPDELSDDCAKRHQHLVLQTLFEESPKSQ